MKFKVRFNRIILRSIRFREYNLKKIYGNDILLNHCCMYLSNSSLKVFSICFFSVISGFNVLFSAADTSYRMLLMFSLV